MYKPVEKRTINDIIQTQIDSTLKYQDKPEKVVIEKINNKHRATVKIINDEISLNNILCIGGNLNVGAIGILFYLDNNERIVIT